MRKLVPSLYVNYKGKPKIGIMVRALDNTCYVEIAQIAVILKRKRTSCLLPLRLRIVT